jgi:two-component system, chemotaxis family, sensor kinase CheA
MDEILQEFLTESAENLDQVERDLVALEESPNSRPLLASIFRNVHTIKGSSGFIGLGRLEKVAHAGENLLSALRDGRIVLNAELTSALLRLIDTLRKMLTHLQQHQTEAPEEHSALIAELGRLLTQGTGKPESPARVVAPPIVPPPTRTAAASSPVVPVLSAAPKPAPAAPSSPPPATPAHVAPAATEHAEIAATAAPAENNVRVSIGLLDKLMNLVGELVLARNQVMQISGGREEAALVAASQRLNLVTSELQEEVMKTRLQSINTVWQKFPRVVRDVSHELGKKVRLELDGKETELDRTIIEAIKDPLTHIVRNSVDHGIESPEARRAAGKPEEGVLVLKAFHEGGQVNIEIRDDGRGIDLTRVKHKAVERGLITTEQAARMPDHEACLLIFAPGLSTAEKVTKISGRGVGMDVVKTNIERIGGTIDVQSTLGQGTTIRIKIPLTLAIIPALMVHAGGERFAIPQVSLVELLRIEAAHAATAIETVMGAAVYRLRGHLLPLVRLAQVLRLPEEPGGDGAVNIVVVQSDGRQFGLIVDRVSDTQEIVVKPLGRHFKSVSVFAGATVLGDGQVALILDVIGLARETRLFSSVRDKSAGTGMKEAAPSAVTKLRLLLFTLDEEHRVALDLSTVGRLEKFSRDRVERAGLRDVVQYRDSIMNLVRLSDYLGYGARDGDESDTLHVVVYTENGRNTGLVVGRIIDIIEDVVRLQTDGARPGVHGRAIVQGRVTEMLDVPGLVRHTELANTSAAGGLSDVR